MYEAGQVVQEYGEAAGVHVGPRICGKESRFGAKVNERPNTARLKVGVLVQRPLKGVFWFNVRVG